MDFVTTERPVEEEKLKGKFFCSQNTVLDSKYDNRCDKMLLATFFCLGNSEHCWSSKFPVTWAL